MAKNDETVCYAISNPRTALAWTTLAFFAGRLVSYTIYVSASSVAADNIEKLLEGGFSSPWVIALQIAALLMVVGLALAPWSRLLARWLPSDPQRSDHPAS